MKAPVFELSFSGGIDQSQRAEVMDPRGAFVALENIRQNARGGASKRWGFSAQTLARLDATNRSAGYKLFAHEKQACVIDGSTLDAYSTAAGCNVSRGRLPECTLGMLDVPSTALSTSLITDGILCGGYYVRVYTVGSAQNEVWATVLDVNDGTVVRAPERLYSGASTVVGLLATYGAHVFLFTSEDSSAQIEYRHLDTTSAATLTAGWSAADDAATDSAGAHAFSVCSLSDRVVLAYANDDTGTDRLTVTALDTSGIVDTDTIGTSSVTPKWCAVQGSIADTLWVAWNEATAVKLIGLDADNLTATLATAATVITMSSDAGNTLHALDVMSSSTAGAGRLFVNDGANDRMHMRSFTTSAGAVSASGSTTTIYNAYRQGRPFRVGSRYYALCHKDSSSNDYTAVVCDLSESDAWVRPVASINPTLAVGYATATASVSGSKVYVPITNVTAQENIYSASTALLDFASSQRFHHVKHAGKTFLGGGMLSVYDGHRVTEAGFVVRPETPETADSGVAGNPNGDYRYVLVYEQIDKTGTWWPSSVSAPTDAQSVTSKKITVTVKPLSISARITAETDESVRLTLYRTAAGGEPPYYYLTSLANTLTASTQTYTDNTSDADLIDNATLFAPSLPGVNGGAQDRRAPPGLTYLVSYAGMLVGAEGESVWYTGQDVAGEGTWFSPLFQVPVSGDGDITGLAAQDGTLYVFKRRAIFAIAGEAPSDNGAAGGLGTPQRLAVDVGCIDARSIVTTSLGILFQSERGIELLSRGGQQVVWIGAKVQDELAARPIVTSAKIDAAQGLVYFELASAETSNQVSGTGRTLVLDLTVTGPDGLPIWTSADRRKNEAGTADTPAQDGCVIWNGSAYRYAWLGTDGRVYVEDQTTHLDPGSTWVRQYAKTSWVHVSGMQGEQLIERALVLCQQHTDNDFSIGIANDYDDNTSGDLKLFDSAAIDAMPSQWIDKDIAQHTGQAVLAELYDATPTGGGASVGTGKGATWIGLTFSGEPKGGVKRSSAANRGG